MRNQLFKLLTNHFYTPWSLVGLVLYITDRCNLKCKFCEIGLSAEEDRNRKELTPSQIDKILKALIKMKVDTIYITGGEPFITKNIWYLMDECVKSSIRIDGITTNGSTLNQLTPSQIDKINRA